MQIKELKLVFSLTFLIVDKLYKCRKEKEKKNQRETSAPLFKTLDKNKTKTEKET